MIDALGFILSLISIPAIVKLDEANTRAKSRAADSQPTGYTLRPSKPCNLITQMMVYEGYVIHKVSRKPYGKAPHIWNKAYSEACDMSISGYDITYKVDENGNVTDQKTTAKERWNMAFQYFINEWYRYRWVYFVDDEILNDRAYDFDKKFKEKCLRDFTPDSANKYDD